MEKQKELLEKEAQRKKNLEELKKENYYHSLEKRRKNQERIQKALSRRAEATLTFLIAKKTKSLQRRKQRTLCSSRT